MANILVVDDEMGIRELLSEILSDEGHAVQIAENAEQARQQRAAGTPDLVLLDIWMPDTDGVTLLKEWQREGLLTMPVIMMSGHATIDTAVEATRIGAVNFLEKPISLQKLLKAVQQGLSKSINPMRVSPAYVKPLPSSGSAPFVAPVMGSTPGMVAGHAAPALPATAEINDSQFFTMTFELPL
ncbi:MAG: response regulator, partial [bacterium]